MGFYYLASPLSHPDPDVQERRFEAACKAAADLIKRGYVVYSPIAHTYPIEKAGFDEAMGWDFWRRQDIEFLRKCAGLFVLRLPGWEESQDVRAEIAIAQDMGKRVEYVDI